MHVKLWFMSSRLLFQISFKVGPFQPERSLIKLIYNFNTWVFWMFLLDLSMVKSKLQFVEIRSDFQPPRNTLQMWACGGNIPGLNLDPHFQPEIAMVPQFQQQIKGFMAARPNHWPRARPRHAPPNSLDERARGMIIPIMGLWYATNGH